MKFSLPKCFFVGFQGDQMGGNSMKTIDKLGDKYSKKFGHFYNPNFGLSLGRLTMPNMKIKALSFSLLTAGLVLAGVPQSHATLYVVADQKSFVGSECKKWSEASDPAIYLNGGRIYNPSSQNILHVDCPIVKDTESDITRSSITVIDQNPNDEICARIVSFYQSGSTLVEKASAEKCTGISYASSNAFTLYFDVPFTTLRHWGSYNYISVRKIPTRYNGRDSGIVGYYVGEGPGGTK